MGSRYEQESLPYDMSHPFDLAVWIGTLVYSEACGAARRDDEQAPHERPSVWELEQDLQDLASNARAVLGEPTAERLSSREAMTTPLAVLRALCPTGDSASPEASGTAPRRAPEVSPDLWRTSSGWLNHFEKDANYLESEDLSDGNTSGADREQGGGVGVKGFDGDDGEEDPESKRGEDELRAEMFATPLATVVYMARLALGNTLTQSEAARRLGVSPARVNALLARGRLCHLRAGRAVLLLEEEVSLGLRDLRRSPGTPGSW